MKVKELHNILKSKYNADSVCLDIRSINDVKIFHKIDAIYDLPIISYCNVRSIDLDGGYGERIVYCDVIVPDDAEIIDKEYDIEQKEKWNREHEVKVHTFKNQAKKLTVYNIFDRFKSKYFRGL